jgi:hypothetical protein
VEDSPPRVQYEQLYRSAVPRRIQADYGPPSPRVDAHSSRLPPPPSRHVSDHETILPSVERETVDLISPPRTASNQRANPDQHNMPREYDNVQSFKRRAYPPAPQSMDHPYGQSAKRTKPSLDEQEVHSSQPMNQRNMHRHTQEYLPMEPRTRHRAHPLQGTIDLTTSPRRPPIGAAGNMYTASQGYSAYPAERQYHTAVRNDHHDRPAGASSHSYIPEHNGMYERRPPPAHEYVPLRR